MTDPASDSAVSDHPTIRSNSPISPGSTTGVRSIGIVRCPACNAVGHTHDAVCAACGEELRRSPRQIKCRHCAQEASSELVVCPGCGRELREAPPRILTWGAPVLLVALFFVVISSQWGRINPISWAFSHFSSGVALVGNLGERIEPEIVIVMTPAPQEVPSAAETSDASVIAMAILTPTVSSEAVSGGDVAASGGKTVQALPVTENGADSSASSAATATATVPAGSLGVGGARPDTPAATAVPTQTPTTVPTTAPTVEPTATSVATNTPLPAATNTRVAATATWTPVSSEPTRAATAAPAMGLAAALSGAQSTASSNATGQVGVAVALVPTATTLPGESTATGGVAQVAGVQTPLLSPTTTTVATSEPTASPTLDVTPTPVVYEIVAGDTLLGIATRLGVTVDALMAANNIASRDVYVIQPGQLLIIPPSATDNADAPVVPTPSTKYYQVRAGDTLVSIAAAQGVTVDDLMAANNIASRDASSLQPGRLLTIPLASDDTDSEEATATAQPTVTPSPTATPLPTVAQPTATASDRSEADATLRLDAPVLLSPEDNTSVSCAESGRLAWQSVRFMRDTDKFLLHLGFVSGRSSDGSEQITWVLAQPRPATTTSWNLDAALCGLAPQAFGRQWRWWVEVVEEVEGELRPVSLPSIQRKFSWN